MANKANQPFTPKNSTQSACVYAVQVGYSESEPDEPGSDTPAAAAAAAASKKRSKGGSSSGGSGKRQRHPAVACEKHKYEVAAGGAVREVHGHMLGPEEADLIESDDSDKVREGLGVQVMQVSGYAGFRVHMGFRV
jgi:hypothetical protein